MHFNTVFLTQFSNSKYLSFTDSFSYQHLHHIDFYLNTKFSRWKFPWITKCWLNLSQFHLNHLNTLNLIHFPKIFKLSLTSLIQYFKHALFQLSGWAIAHYWTVLSSNESLLCWADQVTLLKCLFHYFMFSLFHV